MLLLITIGIFVEVFKTESSQKDEGTEFCEYRTHSSSHYLSINDSINLEIGKYQFRNLCASCHNITMKDDMAGPALEGVFKRFDSDTLKLFEYVKNPEKYLQTKKDKRMILLHKQFGISAKPTNEDLTLNELKSILLYIEKRY